MSSTPYKAINDSLLAAEPSWEAFKSTRLDSHFQPDWQRHQIPDELRSIDNEANMPEKLKQIITWSLILKSAGSATKACYSTTQQTNEDSNPSSAPANKNERSESPQAKSADQLLVPGHHGSDNSADSNTTSTNSSASSNTSDTYSVHSEQSSRGLRVSSRNAGSGVFASTLGLLANLKSRAAREPRRAIVVKAPPCIRSPVECTSCLDDIPEIDTSKLPCRHYYCKPCLTMLVITALQNESSFPPKCCLTAIPLQTILASLDAKQTITYKEKAAEFSIPPQERSYCPNVNCAKWIRPSKLFRIPSFNERCPHCTTRICTICRGLAHNASTDCPQDFGLEAMMALAEQEGWSRCVKCRTLVERSQGCRHMTCKCGAQFCYTCGSKWRTCKCTETDEVNRQARLRRRRGERESAREAEAEEIARVIAEVEDAERRNAREHRQQEERRAEEQRREEAELARLEEQRLREEEAMRLEEARLEQELRRILRVSVEESCAILQDVWNEVRQTQMQSLDSRHMEAERRHGQGREEALGQQVQENEVTLQKMEWNIEKRILAMKERHGSELATFTHQFQDIEDDLFLEIQVHLREQQDKEARERRLRKRFHKQQEGKRQELLAKHDLETKAFQANVLMEMQGLKLVNQSLIANVEHKLHVELTNILTEVATDRACFDLLSKRRQNMVAAHSRLMLEALEAGRDPIGLTEEIARKIGPFLPDIQKGAYEAMQQPCQDKLSSLPSFAELATTSQHLLNKLDQSPPNLPGASVVGAATGDQLQLNSAFAWMTGALGEVISRENVCPVNHSPGLTRSRAVNRHSRPRPRLMTLSPTASPSRLVPVGSWSMPPSPETALASPRQSAQSSLPSLQISEEISIDRLPGQSFTSTLAGVADQPAPESQQDRVLGGLVPVKTSQDRRVSFIDAMRHRRQASSYASMSPVSPVSP